MKKWISMIASGVVGLGFAALAAWGVTSASTAAPDHNPGAAAQTINYGSK